LATRPARQRGSASSPEANDFPIEEGSGYFVLAVAPPPTGEWAVSGPQFTQAVALDLVVGLNLISVPLSSVGATDAASLAEAIADQGSNAAQVIRWSSASQSFLLWSASSPEANIFGVGSAEGCFVLVTTAGQVSP